MIAPTRHASPATRAALGHEIAERRAELLRQMGQDPAILAAWAASPPSAKLKLRAAIDDHLVSVGMPHASAALRLPYAELRRAEWTLALSAKRYAMAQANAFAVRVQRPAADLCQEALIGLHRAAIRWDPRRGVQFMTYALGWIQAAMQEALASTMAPVTVTHDRYQARRRRENAINAGRTATSYREAQLLGVGWVDLDATPLALDSSAADAQRDAARTLAQPLATLPTVDLDLLRHLYWLDQDHREIGAARGTSHQAVQQRHARIISTLRGRIRQEV